MAPAFRPPASILLASVLGVVVCAERGDAAVPAHLELRSPAFTAMAAIPAKYTCEGDDVSPPLSWTGVPEGTQSLVLIVDDPDAPDPAMPTRIWVHWLVFDIPPSATGLPEAASAAGLPPGSLQGRNDWQRDEYGGPCPPIGRHRYFFKLYALDRKLGLSDPNKATLVAAMKGHILAQGELIGTYQKQGRGAR